MSNGEPETKLRFYVQHPHISYGHAVIDSEHSSLVAVADGPSAISLSRGLNAATDPEFPILDRIDAIKQIDPALMWRAVEHLSVLFREQLEEL